MQLTIQIISYCRLTARAERIFRGALNRCHQRVVTQPEKTDIQSAEAVSNQ